MKIRIAIDRCMGHGQCEMLAPTIFRVGDSDVVEQLREPRPGDAAELEGLRAAARNCPEQVISLYENAAP